MKKKQSKKAFTIDLKVYPFTLRFSFGETDEQLLSFLKKTEGPDIKDEEYKYSHHSTLAYTVLFDSNVGLIRMRAIPKSPLDFGYLQHEITHYVMFLLFETLHIPHNRETTEVYSYLTGYITEQAYLNIFLK